jgi:hypothetical protein
MSINALPSQGVEVKVGSGSPITFTAIKEINSFSGPGGAGQVIDVTDLSSDAIEKIMGLHDEGQLSFDINFIPSDEQHVLLRTLRSTKAKGVFQISFTDTPATVWEFTVFVTGFSVSGGVNAPIKASVTIEISGEIEES